MPMPAPRGSEEEEEEEEVVGIGIVVTDGDGDWVGFWFRVEDGDVCVEGGGEDDWAPENCGDVCAESGEDDWALENCGEDSDAIVGVCNICVTGDDVTDNTDENTGEDVGPEIWDTNTTPTVPAETTPAVSNNTPTTPNGHTYDIHADQNRPR